MNKQPISDAHDTDLRTSQAAMERAAVRARELAARTGTELIVSRDGVLERIKPQTGSVQEPPAPYGTRP